MAVNLFTKYQKPLEKRYADQSFTDAYAGKDFEWDGVQSIVLTTSDKVAVNDYSRTASSNRFGTPGELGDVKQTLTMSKDRSFTFIVDSGNASDQGYIKKVNDKLMENWDEVVTPEIDTYRLGVWANGAALGVVGTAPAVGTIHTLIATATAAMNNKHVPKKNRVLFVPETYAITCKLADKVLAVPEMAKKSLGEGAIGMLDGMAVVPIPDSYFPTGVCFIIKHKKATADPLKLKTLRVQHNPPGVDGDLGECRYYHDSFVRGAKSEGIYTYVATGSGLSAPTLTNSSNDVTFACTGATGVKYTLDGSDPKTAASPTTVLAAAFSTPVTLTAGQVMRAYGYATGKVNSAISETSYSA
jgi:hypothetical protein